MTKVDANWKATIDSTIDGYFSKVLGAPTLSTSATAIVSCTTSVVGGYALFAGGVCGEKTLDWSGSDNSVTGGIHSNDGIYVAGSSNTVDGVTTSGDPISGGGSGNTFTPPAAVDGPFGWPITFDAADFLPDLFDLGNGSPLGNKLVEGLVGSDRYHFYDGKIDSGVLLSEGWMTGSVLQPGVYVATDDIDLSISNLSVANIVGVTQGVTFVSAPKDEGKGIVTLSGSNQMLNPFYEGLLVFSDSWKGNPGYPYDEPLTPQPDCFDPAIKLSGSDQDWEGILYAPRGMVDLSGSTNVSIDGSVISYTIRIGGSTQDITFVGSGGPSEPNIMFIQ